MSPSARRRHVRCRSLLPKAFVRRGNGAPRRFVVCEAGVQVNVRVVGRTRDVPWQRGTDIRYHIRYGKPSVPRRAWLDQERSR
jgi:hypothetical protein